MGLDLNRRRTIVPHAKIMQHSEYYGIINLISKLLLLLCKKYWMTSLQILLTVFLKHHRNKTHGECFLYFSHYDSLYEHKRFPVAEFVLCKWRRNVDALFQPAAWQCATTAHEGGSRGCIATLCVGEGGIENVNQYNEKLWWIWCWHQSALIWTVLNIPVLLCKFKFIFIKISQSMKRLDGAVSDFLKM